ncbi:MICOS complex subunit MIC10-like [Ostrinia furnacalis]|uniref:MICOS complex subunit MIC10-like n=1 Tax=Ostrinia furnacalis TaxID=93504 RepID=UPI00103C9B63|nr:MICOS complex subunit MIC10-like [Ostrinia furnacalis]
MARGKKEDAEDEYSAKLDMCLTDGIVKTGGGVLLGALTSVLFLRRRRWPVIAGMGMGIGLAYANCEYELNPKKKSTA